MNSSPVVRTLILAGLLAAAAGCDSQPVSILQLEMKVNNSGYLEEYFSIIGDMNVTFQLKVLQGGSVDVRLSQKDDPTSYKPSFSGDQVRERNATAVLEKGNYVLRVRESTPKDDKGLKEATVFVSMKGTPTRALRRK